LSTGKAKGKGKDKLNLPVIGVFLAFLAIVTVFIYYPSYEESLPAPFIPTTQVAKTSWMAYAGNETNKFKLVNITAISMVSDVHQAAPQKELVSLSKPVLNITVDEAYYVLALEYPQEEGTVTVNAIGLKPSAIAAVTEALSSLNVSVLKAGSVPIYSVFTLGSKIIAYMALNGGDLLYAEGGGTALNKMRKALEAFQSEGTSTMDDASIRKGLAIANSVDGLQLGISLTTYGEGVKGALFNWRTLTYRDKALVSLQAIGYKDDASATTNAESAKTIFFDPKEKVAQLENFLTGVKKQETEDLRPALMAL